MNLIAGCFALAAVAGLASCPADPKASLTADCLHADDILVGVISDDCGPGGVITVESPSDSCAVLLRGTKTGGLPIRGYGSGGFQHPLEMLKFALADMTTLCTPITQVGNRITFLCDYHGGGSCSSVFTIGATNDMGTTVDIGATIDMRTSD